MARIAHPILLLLLLFACRRAPQRPVTRLTTPDHRHHLTLRQDSLRLQHRTYRSVYPTRASNANDEGLRYDDLNPGPLYFRPSQDSVYFLPYAVFEDETWRAVEQSRFLASHEQLVYTGHDSIGTTRTLELDQFQRVDVTFLGRERAAPTPVYAFGLRYRRIGSHLTQLRGVKVTAIGQVREVSYLNYIGEQLVTFIARPRRK